MQLPNSNIVGQTQVALLNVRLLIALNTHKMINAHPTIQIAFIMVLDVSNNKAVALIM